MQKANKKMLPVLVSIVAIGMLATPRTRANASKNAKSGHIIHDQSDVPKIGHHKATDPLKDDWRRRRATGSTQRLHNKPRFQLCPLCMRHRYVVQPQIDYMVSCKSD